MSHLPDLEAWGDPRLRAVGWLEPGHPHAKGEVSEAVFEKLLDLLVDPWQPFAALGSHRCGLCRFSGGPRVFRYKDRQVDLGSANLFLPGEGVVYVAPSLILHYMDSHGYAPPAVFQAAALACPESRGIAYLKALRANGPRDLAGEFTEGS